MGTPNSLRPLRDIRAVTLLRPVALPEEQLLAGRMRVTVVKLVWRFKPHLKNIVQPLPVFAEEECSSNMHPFNPRVRGLPLLRLTDITTHQELFLGENGEFFIGHKCCRVGKPEHFHIFMGAVEDGHPHPGYITWERAKFGELIAAFRARYREVRERRLEILRALEEDLRVLDALDGVLEGQGRRRGWPPPI